MKTYLIHFYHLHAEYLPSCWHIQQQLSPVHPENGVYRIQTSTTNTILDVFCDMETDGGGWILVYSYR